MHLAIKESEASRDSLEQHNEVCPFYSITWSYMCEALCNAQLLTKECKYQKIGDSTFTLSTVDIS